MRQASKKLLASKDQAEQMAGAYIHGLLFKTGDHALSRPSAERHAHLYLTDSPCLGRFHIALEQAGIDALFTREPHVTVGIKTISSRPNMG
jgi:hypothetical protein